jgi:hypothetical protein
MSAKKPLTDSEKVAAVQAVLKKYECWSGEQIAQSDSFYENAVSIVDDIAEIVGWAPCPYDDEDDEDDNEEETSRVRLRLPKQP